VTVPSELGAALLALAERRGETVSTIVTDAIAGQVRLAALDLAGLALADADRKFGAVDDELAARAEAQLAGSSQPRRRRPARRARTK
jgi:hypothetical protein